jgi:hypothetical protein
VNTVLKSAEGTVYGTVSTRKRGGYPVLLELSNDLVFDNGVVLSVDEARALADELKLAAREAEDATRSYVRVTFPSSPAQYTYIDPSGTLKVGDRVIVPPAHYALNHGGMTGQSYGSTNQADVVALGKSASYDGPYKSVVAKVTPL